ncbi:hypothetical protein IAT38_005953 [Cryptococcus sp. DSM 104549]
MTLTPSRDITTLAPLPPSLQSRIFLLLKDAPSLNLLCTCKAVYEECAYAFYREVKLHSHNAAVYLARPPLLRYGSIYEEGHPGGMDGILISEEEEAKSDEEVRRRGAERKPLMSLLEMTPLKRMAVLRGSTVSLAVLDIDALVALAETSQALEYLFFLDEDVHPD